MEHFLDRSTVVNRWNQDYPNRIEIESGDIVRFEMRDSSDGQVKPGMSATEFEGIDKTRIHALTGPVGVAGSEPGDRLVIEILDYAHEGWGWSGLVEGLGLLAEDFSEPFLHTWKLEATSTRSMPGLTIPLMPFCGIIGVQPTEKGEFRTRPPGSFGGNLDVRHLTAGTRLHLPVQVPGAGLCAGDAHAAQGDGEVCLNGMEAPMTVRMKVDLLKNRPLQGPYLEFSGPMEPPAIDSAGYHVFIESDEDPREASKRVVRRVIDYLGARLGLSREQAYITCSVLLRLKISQLVNAPVMTISGYFPEAVFDERSEVMP